jgi:EpsI family protein
VTGRRLLLVACVMAATGVSLRLAAAADLAPEAARLNSLPLQISSWRGTDAGRLDADTENVLRADAYLWRTYTRGVAPLTLFVAYYATQRSGHTVHSPLNCLPGTGWEWIERGRQQVVFAPGHGIDINRNVAYKNGQQALVYYWYQSRGRAVASEYRNKLLLVRDALVLQRSDGALVRVTAATVPGDSRSAQEATAFIQAMYPALTAYLPE